MISPYEWEETACVILCFEDASVPPEGHRSFSMQFTPNDIKIEVDSYGHILAFYKVDITLEKFMLDSGGELCRIPVKRQLGFT